MYEKLSTIAGTWGLLFLLLLFLVAVVYALWPANKQKFDQAKQVPLKDEEPDDQTSGVHDEEDRS